MALPYGNCHGTYHGTAMARHMDALPMGFYLLCHGLPWAGLPYHVFRQRPWTFVSMATMTLHDTAIGLVQDAPASKKRLI